jgi:Putative Ig domain
MNRFRSVAILALVVVSLAGLSSCLSGGNSSGTGPTITTTTIPATATAGVAYAGATISSTGGTPPLSYSISSGQLPVHMTLSAAGKISGTPQAAGTFMFVVQVQDSHNPPRTAVSPQFTITVSNPAPPAITCPGTLSGTTCQLPAVAALGNTVNATFTATGTGPFSWSEVGAPTSLMMVPTTGVLTGEATQPGANQPFTVTVRDVAGQTASLNCTITIPPAAQQLTISFSGMPPNGTVGTPYGGYTVTASGGLLPYFWALTGNPPPGLSITNGVISGTPTLASTTAYTFQIEAGDSQNPQKTAFAPLGNTMFSVTVTSNIVVGISNPFTVIDVNATPVQLTATVSGDVSPTDGVTWSLQSGTPLTDCAGTSKCGTITPSITNDLAATYTPPTVQPSGANDTPTITATAVDDPSKSASFMFTINAAGAAVCATGRESAMNGSFAYLMKGFDANGAVAIAGSFHADGTGKITGGVEDINRAGTGPQTNLAIDPSSSSYTLGADGRGCMTVATATGQQTFRYSVAAFSNGAPMEGNIIEFDDKTGEGTRGSGILRAQDASSFSNEKLASGYAFGLSGFGAAGEHVALAGIFTADGKGNIVAGNFDRNDAGTLTANSSKLVGTYSIPAGSTTGRGTFNATLNGTPFTLAAYVVNSGEVILAGMDQVSATNQITSGEALASAGPFNNSTLAGSHILRETAMSRSGSNPGTRAMIGVLTFDGKNAGGVTGTLFNDEASVSSTTNILHGAATYSVDAGTGRITFTGVGTDSPVGYIVHGASGVTAFLVGTDSGAADGALEFQSAANASFKTSTFSGAYSFGTDENVDYSITNESHSGSFAKSSDASVSGESDQSQPHANGLVANQPFSNAFVFNAEGIGTSGKNPAVTNGTRIFFIDERTESTHPRVTIAEKQ